MMLIYPACFYKEKNGYSVIFPDLEYLSTCGNTLVEAFGVAMECLASYVDMQKEEATPLPVSSELKTLDPKALAKELDFDFEDVFVNFVTVDADESYQRGA